MNPACQRELFSEDGDIIEKAHIDPYCETANNTFENAHIRHGTGAFPEWSDSGLPVRHDPPVPGYR